MADIVLGGTVAPSGPNPIARNSNVLGTEQQVFDVTGRDAIPDHLRTEGLTAYVVSTGEVFRLVGGITNGDWLEVERTPIQFANRAALAAYDVLHTEVGALAYVLSQRAYFKLAQSTATVALPPAGVSATLANDATSPSPGTRSWCRLWIPAPDWQYQAEWHIGEGGDDELDGHNETYRLGSFEEIQWRLAGLYSRSITIFLKTLALPTDEITLVLVPIQAPVLSSDPMTITVKPETVPPFGTPSTVVSYVYTGGVSAPVIRVNDPAPGYYYGNGSFVRITTGGSDVRYAWVIEDLGVVSPGTRDYVISYPMNDTTFTYSTDPALGDTIEGLLPFGLVTGFEIIVPGTASYPTDYAVRYEMLILAGTKKSDALMTYCIASANTWDGDRVKFRCCMLTTNTVMRTRLQEYEFCAFVGGSGATGMGVYGERASFFASMMYKSGLVFFGVSDIRFDIVGSYEMTSGVCVDLQRGSYFTLPQVGVWSGGGNQNSLAVDRGSRATIRGGASVICTGDAVVSDGATAVATWAAFTAFPTPRVVVSAYGSFLTD